jgi:uncharacterized protein (TIGR00255 family)
MTGFGKGTNETEYGLYTVEIKSVNNRYLDINVKAPHNFLAFEDKIKKAIQNKVKRGKVDVFVNFKAASKAGKTVKFDEALANEYFNALRKASEVCDVHFNGQATDVFRMPEVFTVENVQKTDEEIWAELFPAVDCAVDAFCNMRRNEGANLKSVLAEFLSNMENMFEIIVSRSADLPKEYSAKLKARIAELLGQEGGVEPQRLAAEVALFADRCNVDEEIARFKSHVKQMRELLDSSEPVGRKMDFIVQEMNREVNTTGSKSSDNEITATVIELKSEIEKVREQIQNIE